MKIATWNVNSLKVRAAQVSDWLAGSGADVLALQEIKQTTEAVDATPFEAAGYTVVANGQKTYNGVAILSRSPVADIVVDLPGFDDEQRRYLAATIDGVRVVNVYVPNGQALDSPKYGYKLRWLDALHEAVRAEAKQHRRLVLLGDFNIAPADEDVHDPERWQGSVLVSDAERERYRRIVAAGFTDVFRLFDQPPATFSWWDYRAAGFRRNAGLRIDLILASEALAQRCCACTVDNNPRALERPSDHAPVLAQFRLAD